MSMHAMSTIDLPRLRTLLDEAELDRTRVTRRIRRIRDLIKAVESGEDLADFTDLLDAPRPAWGEPRAPASPPPTSAMILAPPVMAVQQAAPALMAPQPGMGFPTYLGEGLPPGVASPVPLPPAGPALMMPSVDVGALGRMTPEALDALPFGVVTLDATGRVVSYNDTESRMAGLPKESVVGRNFFTEVAPCARVREFEGRFRDFSAGRSRLALETFEFVFHFRAGAQRVVIFISPARYRGQFHVSMIRR
jgi:photoactive yellow protein